MDIISYFEFDVVIKLSLFLALAFVNENLPEVAWHVCIFSVFRYLKIITEKSS